MFTGLVEALATVRQLRRGSKGAQLTLDVVLGPLVLGESISVNGACLTVSHISDGGFVADVSAETLKVTTLQSLATGQQVNVERAMTLGGRLGGHLVMGHVDAVASVTQVEKVGDAQRVTIEPPAKLARYLAAKGSVTLDGVSLTVNRVSKTGSFEVMLVPHTLAETTLEQLRAGQRLNIEVDVLARYAARLMEAAGVIAAVEPEGQGDSGMGDAGMMAALQRGGYV